MPYVHWMNGYRWRCVNQQGHPHLHAVSRPPRWLRSLSLVRSFLRHAERFTIEPLLNELRVTLDIAPVIELVRIADRNPGNLVQDHIDGFLMHKANPGRRYSPGVILQRLGNHGHLVEVAMGCRPLTNCVVDCHCDPPSAACRGCVEFVRPGQILAHSLQVSIACNRARFGTPYRIDGIACR